jgi:hypothetical protein
MAQVMWTANYKHGSTGGKWYETTWKDREKKHTGNDGSVKSRRKWAGKIRSVEKCAFIILLQSTWIILL